jgi:TPR repeat protein
MYCDTRPLTRTVSNEECSFRKISLGLLLLLLLNIFGISGAAASILASVDTHQRVLGKRLGLSDIGYRPAWLRSLRLKAVTASAENETYLANRLWRLLAQQGDSEAAFRLGLYYDDAEGNERDARRAVYWYRRAALGGEIHAQHNLGVAYAKGKGVAMDIAQAIKWWTLAARRGNADSQYNLGILYAAGEYGIQRDVQQAKRWWHKAAMHGDPMAQYNLGTLYVNSGVRDYCKAIRWWKEAARNGVEQANLALRAIKSRADYRACH